MAKQIQLRKRHNGIVKAFTENEVKNLEKGYALQGKDLWDYYEKIEAVKPKEAPKAEEPQKGINE